jgi:hypothetical protein
MSVGDRMGLPEGCLTTGGRSGFGCIGRGCSVEVNLFAGDDDPFVYPPVPVIPQLYVDLDLELLTAADDGVRWDAIIAGTREVIDRFEYLASTKVRELTGPELVIRRLASCRQGFEGLAASGFADWLGSVIEVLIADQALVVLSMDRIRRAATDAEAVTQVVWASVALGAAADRMAVREFGLPRTDRRSGSDHRLWCCVDSCLAVETHRTTLRTDLDGIGGMAGSPEWNPFVGALFRLELATHRRLYRSFYELCAHVRSDLIDDPSEPFDTPDQVDRQAL